MTDAEKKEYRRLICCLFYLKYKDYSLDQLESFLLDLYKKNRLSDFLEISFLNILIEIRSSGV